MTTQLQGKTPSNAAANQSAGESLSIDRVTKRFKQGDTHVEALSEISLSIARGEFLAVMGASGSGKSTLLYVLAGLTWPESGSILIDGSDMARLTDAQLTTFRRRRIGLVFQAFNLIPTLTAAENIRLPLLVDGRTLNDVELTRLARRLGIEGRLHHRPDALSGGEQQRVAIGRALATDPALILADEPTGSLDSVSGQNICRLLRELNEEEGRTIVVVTHEPTVAVWADRIIVLRDGRVLTEFKTRNFSDPHSLAAHYQHVVQAHEGTVAS